MGKKLTFVLVCTLILLAVVGTAAAQDEVDNNIVTYTYAEGAVPLLAEDGSPIGAVYFPSDTGPMTYTVPFQSHALVAFGNGEVNGEAYSAAADEINLVFALCEDGTGCEIVVDEYRAGNIAVTVVFGGSESPRTTATGALARSFKAPNCGGNGCNFVNFYDLSDDENDASYDRPADGATPATINPNALEEITVEVKVVGEPDTMVLPGEVGHLARPATTEDGEMFFSASEGGHTIVTCDNGCTVAGTEVTSEQVVWVIGNETDGSTPQDLNWTFEVTEAEPGDVAILMLYKLETDPQQYLDAMAARLLGEGVTDYDVVEIRFEPEVGGFSQMLRTAEEAISDFFGAPAMEESEAPVGSVEEAAETNSAPAEEEPTDGQEQVTPPGEAATAEEEAPVPAAEPEATGKTGEATFDYTTCTGWVDISASIEAGRCVRPAEEEFSVAECRGLEGMTLDREASELDKTCIYVTDLPDSGLTGEISVIDLPVRPTEPIPWRIWLPTLLAIVAVGLAAILIVRGRAWAARRRAAPLAPPAGPPATGHTARTP